MMSARETKHPVPLREAREQTVDALCRHFAGDALTLAEFERRVDRAHRARSMDDLRELITDLPVLKDGAPATRDAPAGGAGTTADAARPDAARPDATGRDTAGRHAAGTDLEGKGDTKPARRPSTDVEGRARTRFLVAFMAGVERAGAWTPPEHLVVTTMMGGTELDFREARLPPGETRITIGCVMGGVDIIVPPDLAVEASGVAIMGGFEHKNSGLAPSDDAPRLVINGVALMGGVGIDVRRPGETARDAKRRRRRERKRLKSG